MEKMASTLADMFRAKVRTRIAELGISQTELSERLGVTPSYVSQVLSGKRDPGFGTLEAFAVALGVRPVDLIDEKKMAASA